MTGKQKAPREPFIHITKRDALPMKKAVLIRAIAIICGLIFAGIIVMLLTKKNPIKIYSSLIDGNFGFMIPRTALLRIWVMLQELAILLCISLAVTPAFKMRFWNCGAQGQVLIGGLACIICMHYIGSSVSLPLLYIIMIASSIVAGAIWAVIPAIFKAKWNTNETLFSLMMNYIAIQLIAFFIKLWVPSGSGIVEPMHQFGLPVLFGQKYLLNVIVVTIITIAMFVYLKYSKQGYEISVVGESENTAKYIGINVRKVIIRTMIISGGVCGIAGLLIVGGTDHTISTTLEGGRGFTAIMVSWLAKFNPLYMVLTSFLIVFLQRGAKQVSTDFRIDQSISDIMTAIILFFIIGCEFFLTYKIHFRRSAKEAQDK